MVRWLWGLLLVIGLGAPAAQAQDNAPMSFGQFFNHPNLAGEPFAEFWTNGIGYNWGEGAPTAGMQPDAFSARWGLDVDLPAGTYRFNALADDNVRVVVDFNPVPLIDTFGQGRAGQIGRAAGVEGAAAAGAVGGGRSHEPHNRV